MINKTESRFPKPFFDLNELSGDLSQFKLGKAPWGLPKLESRDASARCFVNQLSVRKAWSNLNYHLTRSAIVYLLSCLTRSGAKPGTNEPGAPKVLPPGGVMPPAPEKYGTFDPRWLYSPRNVTYWLGM